MNEDIQVIDLGFVNAFLIGVGDGYVLVDTGVAQQWVQLEAKLLEAGCLPDKLKLVIVTHGDFDHTGNCGRLQKQYHARVAMHPADVAMVKTGIAPDRHTRGWAAWLMLAVGKYFSGSRRFDTFEPEVLLTPGQSLGEYGWAARVLHTPGHTPGAIAILTDRGELFPGDTVGNYRRPAPAPFVDDFGQLRVSLAALQALSAKVVYPGHGKPFLGEALVALKV